MLFAGRISEEKGVDVLVEAFGQLARSAPDCRLVLVGSPSAAAEPTAAHAYEARLQAAAEGLPVTWLPRRNDVVPLLQAADVAVVPSRWAEPLSRSIMEPLACGTPVVATRVGGSPEVLTGWFSDYPFRPTMPSRWRTAWRPARLAHEGPGPWRALPGGRHSPGSRSRTRWT